MFGSKVVALSDSQGGIYNPDGLVPDAVLEYKEKTCSVNGFPQCDSITNGEILSLDVDILIPAALENVITDQNAGSIKARIVAELANGPTTPEADDVLFENGVHVIPDFLCNAGGVTVSYLEMVQNFYMYYWEEGRVYDCLNKKMTRAYHAVHLTSKKYSINMRQAAYIVAVERVVEAMKLRGWV
jgi:glutamate dehydrogenase (NAD(P)+)